eukprot:c4286_g1_i1.p1 GENE.c4286_g1_i1~~c4286_g1_i1.p1  ORF type:complete len:106 (+),score=32.53 c4286_g1_i1:76-393(+)
MARLELHEDEWNIVFQNLPIIDLLKLRRVCRAWRQVAEKFISQEVGQVKDLPKQLPFLATRYILRLTFPELKQLKQLKQLNLQNNPTTTSPSHSMSSSNCSESVT